MKFLADECCDSGIVAFLRGEGHDVLYVVEEKTGIPDDAVLLNASNEERLLLTEDKDFGELVYRLKKPSWGIILIRIDVKQRHTKWARLSKLIENYEGRLAGNFVVIDSQKFRFRPLLTVL